MMRVTRRESLGGLAAAAAALSTPALAKRKKVPPPLDTGPFDDIAKSLLAHMPETATYNGTADALDGGSPARKLDNVSPEGEAATRAALQAGRDLLARIRLRGDSPEAAHLSTISAILENGTRSADIPYGRISPLTFTGHTPYLVSQISGPHIDSPNVMMEQQSLSTLRAVDAFIDKLDAFPGAFANVIEKQRADRAAGCVPPRALIDKTLPVLDAMLAGPAAQQPLILAMARRMEEAGLSKRVRAQALRRATTSLQRRVRPAYAALRTSARG